MTIYFKISATTNIFEGKANVFICNIGPFWRRKVLSENCYVIQREQTYKFSLTIDNRQATYSGSAHGCKGILYLFLWFTAIELIGKDIFHTNLKCRKSTCCEGDANISISDH